MSSTVPTVQPQPAHKATVGARSSRASSQPSKNSAKQLYLAVYNSVSFLLWAALLARVLITAVSSARSKGFLSNAHATAFGSSVGKVYTTNGDYAKWIQTLALVEVVHVLVGLVRAPIMTTAMQVASRILLVWGIVHTFGEKMLRGIAGFESLTTQRNQQAYLGMLLAWGLAECIRYAYFVFYLASGTVPPVLAWLR